MFLAHLSLDFLDLHDSVALNWIGTQSFSLVLMFDHVRWLCVLNYVEKWNDFSIILINLIYCFVFYVLIIPFRSISVRKTAEKMFSLQSPSSHKKCWSLKWSRKPVWSLYAIYIGAKGTEIETEINFNIIKQCWQYQIKLKSIFIEWIFTHKNDLNHLHRKNDKNNALFVDAETVHHDLNSVHHRIHTTDDHDVIYYLDHLSSCASPVALSCMHDVQTRKSVSNKINRFLELNDCVMFYKNVYIDERNTFKCCIQISQ